MTTQKRGENSILTFIRNCGYLFRELWIFFPLKSIFDILNKKQKALCGTNAK